MRQVEVSRTLEFSDPRRARCFFALEALEQLIRAGGPCRGWHEDQPHAPIRPGDSGSDADRADLCGRTARSTTPSARGCAGPTH